jgi:Melibiase
MTELRDRRISRGRLRQRPRLMLLLSLTLCAGNSSRSNAIVDADNAGKQEQVSARSGDAYVSQVGTTWKLATAKVEKTLQLKNGHLLLISFKDKVTNHEYVQGPSDPLRIEVNGRTMTGTSEDWSLAGAHTATLSQKELSLEIILRNQTVQVSEHFVLYPSESIIQESLTIRNISDEAETIVDPYFLQMNVLQKESSAIDFSYMTGGMCFWGSWILKTQALTPDYLRRFDASDAPECLPGKPCKATWSMGNSVYAPIQVYFDRKAKDGVFVGWDYLGRWGSEVGNYRGTPLYVGLKVSGFKEELPAGASVDTPWAFTGVFEKDLDEMGNQLLDYQYRYKWDYTHEQYFPAIQMLGYWWNGASDFDPKHPGLDVEPVSTFRKVFRMTDEMRYVGGDIYWRDYGWWDIAGDWNGPDFSETGRYLSKYGMKQTLYTIVYDAQQGSQVVTNHPDWLIYRGGNFAGQYVLDQSKPGVIDWELGVLQEQVRKWGAFEWRKDDSPLHAVNGDDTPMLAQDQNFRRLLKTFLDRNPQNAFHGCNGGGNDLSYEVLRMADAWQMSDGCVGRYRDYYASYLFPPDKLVNMPDNWDPAKFDKAEWRGLLWNSFPMTGDTLDPAKNEELRLLIDIYHYLANKGVVGRWVKVYHPSVTGDTADWYLQRMSPDNRRGIIMPAHDLKTPITIFPKGLLPGEKYNVSFQETNHVQERLGLDLMTKGISFSSLPDGELIYLGLPMHPGSSADKTPPTPPTDAVKTMGTNMNTIGVELSWSPGHDENWISYYNIYRNGAPIDKVSKGTYYFDHSAGADVAATYNLRAVDASGNLSSETVAHGATAAADLVLNDTSDQITPSGVGWAHQHQASSVAGSSELLSRKAGDGLELKFRGNRLTWYGRLGTAMGQADVYIDGKLDQTVDTYDADEIPNMPVYTRTFSAIGNHTVKVVVRGDHNWRSSDDWLVFNGFQIGTSAVNVVEDAPGSGIEYAGPGWKHSEHWRAASGGNVSWTNTEGDTARYSFQGDGITLVCKRCPSCGIAEVYLDGKLETKIDTYAADFHHFRTDAQGSWQIPVFEKSWPSSGRHEIKIIVGHEKNMLSTDREIYLDALQVMGQ